MTATIGVDNELIDGYAELERGLFLALMLLICSNDQMTVKNTGRLWAIQGLGQTAVLRNLMDLKTLLPRPRRFVVGHKSRNDSNILVGPNMALTWGLDMSSNRINVNLSHRISRSSDANLWTSVNGLFDLGRDSKTALWF